MTLNPLVLNKTILHLLLNHFNRALGIVLGVGIFVVGDLHRLVGVVVEGGAGCGGEGIFIDGRARKRKRKRKRLGEGSSREKKGKVEVGLVERIVDLKEMGWVRGRRKLLGHEGCLV